MAIAIKLVKVFDKDRSGTIGNYKKTNNLYSSK